jgi:anti-sigma factor RsiW
MNDAGMNDTELRRLMNNQLDGVATPEESERLSQALDSREDLRSEYRRLGGVFAVLSRVAMEEPPRDLKQNVMREIRRREAAPSRIGRLDWIRAAFRGWAAYSFAAGAALGVLAFALLTGNLGTRPGTDVGPFTGTMARPSGAVSYHRISSRDFTLRTGRVLVEVLSGSDGYLARIASTAPSGTDLVLSFDPATWDVEGLRQRQAGNEVMLGFGRLSVRIQQSGESQYLLYLARKGPAGSHFRIAIQSPGESVYGELDTSAPGSGG